MEKRYLQVNVYRSDLGDCTNGGVTSESRRNPLFVEHPEGPNTIEDIDSRGGFILELRCIEFGGMKHFHFRPQGVKGHTMAGGNFVWTSDSRFSELYGDHPISVHDRVES